MNLGQRIFFGSSSDHIAVNVNSGDSPGPSDMLSFAREALGRRRRSIAIVVVLQREPDQTSDPNHIETHFTSMVFREHAFSLQSSAA